MMWYWWFIIIFGAMIVGAVLASLGYLIYTKYLSWKLKRMLPGKGKDKALISEYLKQDDVKEAMLNGGPALPLTQKEVEDNERERTARTREFEKLRRFAQGKGSRDPDTPTKASTSESFDIPPVETARDDSSKGESDDTEQTTRRVIEFD